MSIRAFNIIIFLKIISSKVKWNDLSLNWQFLQRCVRVQAVEGWVREARELTFPDDPVIVVVGCKNDLGDQDRQVVGASLHEMMIIIKKNQDRSAFSEWMSQF